METDQVKVKSGRVLVAGEIRAKYQIIDVHGSEDFTSLAKAVCRARGRSYNGKVLVRQRADTGWQELGTYLNGHKTLYRAGF